MAIKSAYAGLLLLAGMGLPTAGYSQAVNLSPISAAQPLLAAGGLPFDITPIVKGAQAAANAPLDAGGLANASVSASPFQGAAPLDTGSLTGAQGGTNSSTNFSFTGAVTEQDLSATNTGNAIVANQITNGPISVGANAFSGFNGVGNVLLNTGNQNNIQGSLSVTVVLAPATGR